MFRIEHRLEILCVRVGADVAHPLVPTAPAHREGVPQDRLAVAAYVLVSGAAASGFAAPAPQIANYHTWHIVVLLGLITRSH